MKKTPCQKANSNDPADRIREIYVEEDILSHPYTRDILDRAGDVRIQAVSDKRKFISVHGGDPKSLTQGKRHLLLCQNKGKFLKPCPATREYTCCGYQVLNIGTNCPMDCVYCILQAYLNNPWLSFFVNIDDLLAELDAALFKNRNRFWRIGTGEFTDSLALDRLTGLSRILVEYMRDKSNAVLELKTKTARIHNLQDLDHGGRTVVAWSLNSQRVVEREELHSAPLKQRLAAAAQCASWGYKLAFHFDPIIYYDGWEEGYNETISLLFETVPKKSIVWISLGCLRFLPALKFIAGERFPRSAFFYEEFTEGLDGKYRYFRALRETMYRFLYERISDRASSDTCVYLCMESDEVWRQVFHFTPEEQGGLSTMLDRAAQRVVPGNIISPDPGISPTRAND